MELFRGRGQEGGQTAKGQSGAEESEKKRPDCADENAAASREPRERERREWWPAAPEGYKFMSMQHKVASTTSQPIRTPPSLPSPTRRPSRTVRTPVRSRPFDTGSGVPIDLDRLKTRRNHRRQSFCGRRLAGCRADASADIPEISASGTFCRRECRRMP